LGFSVGVLLRAGKAPEKFAKETIVVVALVQVRALMELKGKLVICEMELIWANANNRACNSQVS